MIDKNLLLCRGEKLINTVWTKYRVEFGTNDNRKAEAIDLIKIIMKEVGLTKDEVIEYVWGDKQNK